ncbi:MAG: tyrosine recombinase XerC [Pseudomonadota bacterium]|nr:tyrosine recombinase XerC [Pseudomonadota bacterium]
MQAEGPLSTAITAFLAALVARHYSPATVATYTFDLRHLLERVGERGGEIRPASLTSHDIRRALATLHSKGLQAKTLARTLSAWRSFFNYLARQGVLQANPCLGLRPPKSEKKLPNAPSVDAMAQLLAGVPTGEPEDLWAVRNLAMFELMYSAGLRRAELIGLDIGGLDGVDLAGGEVTVTGKGSRMRVVPVGKKAVQAVQNWLAVRANVARVDTQALFVGVRGARISAGVLALALKQLAQRQGITSRMHPHALRHAFASHVLQSSGDLRAVQEMLGHASLSTTQIYTHLDFQHLAKVYDQAHPRAKKK